MSGYIDSDGNELPWLNQYLARKRAEFEAESPGCDCLAGIDNNGVRLVAISADHLEFVAMCTLTFDRPGPDE